MDSIFLHIELLWLVLCVVKRFQITPHKTLSKQFNMQEYTIHIQVLRVKRFQITPHKTSQSNSMQEYTIHIQERVKRFQITPHKTSQSNSIFLHIALTSFVWGYLESLYSLLDMDSIFLHIELLWLVLCGVIWNLFTLSWIWIVYSWYWIALTVLCGVIWNLTQN